MKPLSARKRLIYLVVMVTLFFLVVPIALFFASGWRYKSGFGFVRTGGIFVSVPFSDATIFIDGQPVGSSGFLNHRLYFSDLAPSAYVVHVEKEGYRPWDKVLVVEPQLVTDAEAFLIPEEVAIQKIVVLTATSTAATGTAAVTRGELNDIVEAFATTTLRDTKRSDMQVALVNGDVVVRWDGGERTPSIFCGRPSYCVRQITLEHTKQTATSALFFGSGVVYVTKEGGIFYTEVDVRPTLTSHAIYPHAGSDARVVQGRLIVKDGKSYYRLSGI